LIVYVETNFILELAYLRSTSDNCQRLLELARDRRVQIVISSFALVEARLAWQRKVSHRNSLHSAVRSELKELARSRPLIEIPAQSQAFVAALIDSAQQDRGRLEAAVDSIITVATVTPTDPPIVMRAYEVEQRTGLSPQDALVYATVVSHLEHDLAGPKVFVTQNKQDFVVVKEELARYDCKLLFKFDAVEGYVRSQISG
jgi:predicted nucleic acid-binding protein